jgi:putative transposase
VRISHDALQRLLQIERDWNHLLRQRYRHLLNGRLGRLIIDDTVLAKPFSRACPMLAWLWSSSDRRYLYGISCVLLIWTNGHPRVPLGVRFWSKNDNRSKLDLAIELLQEAKRLWKPRVDYVVFDSWYAAAKLMKATRELGWHWLTRLKRNRVVNGRMRVDCYFQYRYGHARLRLNKSIPVLVVKDSDAFCATSNRRLSPHAVKTLYRQRQWIEEVIRVLKSQLNIESCIESCAARSEQAQTAHVYLALMAFCQLEHLRITHGIGTIYQLREQLLNSPVPRKLAWNLPLQATA